MSSYSSVVDRIYKRYASVHPNVAYLHHPSGVTVVVLREVPDSEVVEVNFGSHKRNGVDRAENTVVGKGKRGGLQLQTETRLCSLKCKDGREIIVRAGVRGTLAEVNDRLKLNPDLVRTASENQGYIAIVTYAPGKRKPEEFVTELPGKKVALTYPIGPSEKEEADYEPAEKKPCLDQTDVKCTDQVETEQTQDQSADVPSS